LKVLRRKRSAFGEHLFVQAQRRGGCV
jgi:hypothetical protein